MGGAHFAIAPTVFDDRRRIAVASLDDNTVVKDPQADKAEGCPRQGGHRASRFISSSVFLLFLPQEPLPAPVHSSRARGVGSGSTASQRTAAFQLDLPQGWEDKLHRQRQARAEGNPGSVIGSGNSNGDGSSATSSGGDNPVCGFRGYEGGDGSDVHCHIALLCHIISEHSVSHSPVGFFANLLGERVEVRAAADGGRWDAICARCRYAGADSCECIIDHSRRGFLQRLRRVTDLPALILDLLSMSFSFVGVIGHDMDDPHAPKTNSVSCSYPPRLRRERGASSPSTLPSKTARSGEGGDRGGALCGQPLDLCTVRQALAEDRSAAPSWKLGTYEAR